MVRYNIKYKNIAPNIEEKHILTYDCYIGVSMNNPLFFSKGLPALLKWISSHYPHCTIIVADYLDRLNQQIFNEGLTLEGAINACLENGKRIRYPLQECVTDLHIKNITINHWLKYYEKQQVQTIKQQLFYQLYKKSDLYKCINHSAIEYLKKKSTRVSLCNDRNIFLSIEYIIEELAVISYLVQTGARVQLYPGTNLPILKKIANKELILSDSNLDQGIYVDLTVKKIGKEHD